MSEDSAVHGATIMWVLMEYLGDAYRCHSIHQTREHAQSWAERHAYDGKDVSMCEIQLTELEEAMHSLGYTLEK